MTFWLDAHLDPSLAAWMLATFSVDARSFDELGFRSEKDHKIMPRRRHAATWSS